MTPWLLTLFALALAGVLHLRLARQMVLVAQASHELRGALCSLQLRAEASGVKALAWDLRRAALALDDLALANRLRRARDRRREVDLAELAEQIGSAWGERVLAAVVPVTVVADPARLGQALANLVANALEHGDGPVRLCVRRLGGRARVEVSDGGPGLPAAVPDLVRAARRRRTSRGHGLAVAARIADSHGGRLLTAPSEQGACLVLELPVAPAPAQPLRSALGWRRSGPADSGGAA